MFGVFLGCQDSALTTCPPNLGGQAGGSGGNGASSGNTGNNPTGGTGGESPGGPDLPVGTKVWTAGATKLVADLAGDGGGYSGAPGTAAPPCERGWTYTLTMADRKLSWHLCDNLAPAATALQIGERILSPEELATVVQPLGAVTVSNGTGFGADKPTMALTITTPAGEREFFDDFYAAYGPSGRTFVANVDPVFAALSALAK